MDEWNGHLKESDLKISKEKSEVLVVRTNRMIEKDIILEGVPLKKVDRFNYLGAVISEDGKMEGEITARLLKGGNFYQTIKHLVWDKSIPMEAKMIMFKSYYVPICLRNMDHERKRME